MLKDFFGRIWHEWINQNTNNSFTFDFLTKLLSQFSITKTYNNNSSNNNTKREKNDKSKFESLNPEINYATPMQDGRNVYQLVQNRNYDNNNNYNFITKKKISKSIRLNESPFYQGSNVNQNYENKIIRNTNNKNRRNYQLSKNKSSRQNIAIKNLLIHLFSLYL